MDMRNIMGSIRTMMPDHNIDTNRMIDILTQELNKQSCVYDEINPRLKNLLQDHYGSIETVCEQCTEFGISQLPGVGAAMLDRLNLSLERKGMALKSMKSINRETPLKELGVPESVLTVWNYHDLTTVGDILKLGKKGIYTGIVTPYGLRLLVKDLVS